MRIGRTLPPAAAPLLPSDLLSGVKGIIFGSRQVEGLRQELREFFDKKHCFLVSSGKAALTLILMGLKELHPDRDQVLLPAFACYSVPSAVVRAGLQIQLCDIDLKTLDYDFDLLEEKLKNPRLLCVMSVHLFGLPSDVERIRRMRQDPDITIVEDAAQAMGGEWEGRKLGTQGDVGFFSLGRGKALTAVEGGVIVTDNQKLGACLHTLVERLPSCSAMRIVNQFFYALALLFLLRPKFFWLPSAIPFLRLGETRFDPNFQMYKLSIFQAGLIRDVRNKLSKFRSQRQVNIKFWYENLQNHLVKKGSGKQLLPDLLRFPLHIGNSGIVELILGQSARLGLGLARTYPDTIHSILEIEAQFDGQDFPRARRAAQELLTLPVHGFITPRDRELIVNLLVDEGEGKRQ